jgi:anti-sigma factor RsiW
MNLSDRDLETLSAFLDGEISGRDQERLEARLQSDEALRVYLEGLRRTRAAVRSLPILRAPRNYYLTPEMVGQKGTTRRLFPVLSFASALATMLFVLLLVGDFITINNPAFAPLRALEASEQVVQVLEAPLAGTLQFESELPEDLADEFLEQSPVEERMPSAEEAPLAAAPEAPAEELEQLPIIGESLATGEPDSVEEVEGAVESAPAPMEEPGIQAHGKVSVTPLPDDQQRVIPLRGILRVLEVIMIIVAISTGIAAFFLYRKK